MLIGPDEQGALISGWRGAEVLALVGEAIGGQLFELIARFNTKAVPLRWI